MDGAQQSSSAGSALQEDRRAQRSSLALSGVLDPSQQQQQQSEAAGSASEAGQSVPDLASFGGRLPGKNEGAWSIEEKRRSFEESPLPGSSPSQAQPGRGHAQEMPAAGDCSGAQQLALKGGDLNRSLGRALPAAGSLTRPEQLSLEGEELSAAMEDSLPSGGQAPVSIDGVGLKAALEGRILSSGRAPAGRPGKGSSVRSSNKKPSRSHFSVHADSSLHFSIHADSRAHVHRYSSLAPPLSAASGQLATPEVTPRKARMQSKHAYTHACTHTKQACLQSPHCNHLPVGHSVAPADRAVPFTDIIELPAAAR